MIVTIDGPAGSGKSTIAKMVGARSRLMYLNSGSIYRGITYGLYLQLGEDTLRAKLEAAPDTLATISRDFSIGIAGSSETGADYNDTQGDIILNGEHLDQSNLRSDLVDSLVAQVSSIPAVREQVNTILKQTAQNRDIVVEGRDMSTIVFPSAELQFYLDASIEARAKRRYEQGTSSLSYEELLDTIAKRDSIDTQKDVGALKVSPQAKYLDTSGLTIEQVCEIVLESIREHK